MTLSWLRVQTVRVLSIVPFELQIKALVMHVLYHGLRTPNKGINQRDLKNWDDEVDKICFGPT